MTLKVTTFDQDKGEKALMEELKKLKGSSVDIGVFGGQEGEGVVRYAAANEFGAEIPAEGGATIVIPERSFIRSTTDETREENHKFINEGRKRVIAGKEKVKGVLTRLGLKGVKDIQTKIRSDVPPPNAASTVAKKGSSGTLRDTGTLMKAVTYKVNMGEEKVTR